MRNRIDRNLSIKPFKCSRAQEESLLCLSIASRNAFSPIPTCSHTCCTPVPLFGKTVCLQSSTLQQQRTHQIRRWLQVFRRLPQPWHWPFLARACLVIPRFAQPRSSPTIWCFKPSTKGDRQLVCGETVPPQMPSSRCPSLRRCPPPPPAQATGLWLGSTPPPPRVGNGSLSSKLPPAARST